MPTHRTLAALLAVTALGASGVPAASAKPMPDPPRDLHDAILEAAAHSRGGQRQDLRSGDARDAARPQRGPLPIPPVSAEAESSPVHDDGGVDAPVLGAVLGGSVLLAGAAVALSRPRPRRLT